MDPDELARAEPTEPFSAPVENDPTAAVESAEPYFAPTDTVFRTGHEGRVEVASGFDTGEVHATDAAPADVLLADDALAQTVRRELRHDAKTAHLELIVDVLDAIATLRGKVQDEADAESAIAVAGRVPGIDEVIDALTRS